MQSLCFDSMFSILSVCACLSHNYDHTHLPIVMKIGINLLGTKAKRPMCKDFKFLFCFKIVVLGFYRRLSEI